MKQLLKYLHPFFFALYPVVFLYAKNIHEYPENTIIVPILIVLFFAGVVLFVLKLLLKKIERAAIIASAIVLSFLSYSRLIAVIDEYKPSLDPKIISVGLMILFIAASCFVAFKYTQHLLSLNKFLTFLSLFLVLLSFWKIIAFEMETKRIFIQPKTETHETVKKVTPPKNAPDIYYIIFDRYAGEKALSEQYNFDNSKFIKFLENKGFYVADDAKANYPKTFLSIPLMNDLRFLGQN